MSKISQLFNPSISHQQEQNECEDREDYRPAASKVRADSSAYFLLLTLL
jgi:hypothetical protein